MNTRIDLYHRFDRRNLLDCMKARQRGYDAYMLDRLDTHWFHMSFENDVRIDFCVEPTISDDNEVSFFICVQNYEVTATKKMYEEAQKAFSASKEFVEMKAWITELNEKGYFEDGVYPGKNTYKCKHCGGTYKRGTIHEHVMYNDRIICHNGKQYEKIKKDGLNVNWTPNISAEEQSLEDQGILDGTCEP